MDEAQIAVGLATVTLYIPYSHSLKAKRGLVKPLLTRLRNRFNLSVAEVGSQDQHQNAILALVCVSSNRRYAEGLLQRAANAIETWRLDAEVMDVEIEWLA